MTSSRRRLLGALPLLAVPALACAEPAWPSRPLRLIVPFPAGGATDAVGRAVADGLSRPLGQPVVVENRAGAAGNIGAELAAQTDDDHTLLLTTTGIASSNQFLYSRMPYRQEDLQAVALVSVVANGILANPSVPADSLQALLALARRQPGALSYGTPGNGTTGHLCAELLKARAGIDLLHVPFRGTSGVVPELLAGRLQLAIDNLPAYLPHVRDGKLRLLAVTSADRWFAVPETPTVRESGIEGFEGVAWFGIAVPSRMPAARVERLSRLVVEVCKEPTLVNRLRDVGSEPRPLDRPAFQQFIEAETVKWREVIRASGARLD